MAMSQIFIHMIRLLYLKLCLSINSHTHHNAIDFQLDWMAKNEQSIYCVESIDLLHKYQTKFWQLLIFQQMQPLNEILINSRNLLKHGPTPD